MNSRKKLIELALPLEDTNREAAREKSIRHGHPSGLHLWPAHGHARAGHAVGVLLTVVLFLAAGTALRAQTALRQRLKASPFRIAYECYVNDNWEILDVIDFCTKGMVFHDLATGTTEPHPFSTNLHHLYNPCFAPNGKWILATVNAGMGLEHAIVLIEARNDRHLTLAEKQAPRGK